MKSGSSPLALLSFPKLLTPLHKSQRLLLCRYQNRRCGKNLCVGKMREHFSRVKDCVLVAVQRRDAGRAEHEITHTFLRYNITPAENFARWATSLFSRTEAGHGPAPSLRLLLIKKIPAPGGRREKNANFRRNQYSADLWGRSPRGRNPPFPRGPSKRLCGRSPKERGRSALSLASLTRSRLPPNSCPSSA